MNQSVKAVKGKKSGIKQNIWFKVISLVVVACIIMIGVVTTPPEGLEVTGWRMLMLVLGVVVLFFSEAMPVPAVCFIVVVLMKYLNIVSFKTIQQTAMSQVVYFIMVSFGIGAAMKKTNLTPILLKFLFKIVKGSSRRLVLVMTVLTAILSVVVNNGVAQVVVLVVTLSMFKALGDPEPGTSRLCKAIILGICVGSQTGGLMLPCSNAVNAVVLDLAETIGGQPMTFFQWALYGIPASIVMTLFGAWVLNLICKPEPLTEEQMSGLNRMFDEVPDKLERNDWVFVVVVALMVVGWIAGNWVKTLDIATVAMIGMFIMMLPGIGILTPKEYYKNFGGSNIVVLTCLLPMASAMASSGAGEWVINHLFAGAPNWSIVMVYIMAAVTAFVVHLLVPSGSANAALSATIIGPVAVACGVPAAAILFVVGLQAGSSYLLPVDGIWGYTLGYGYYEFSDPLRKCWPIVVAAILFAIIIVPLLTTLYTGIGFIA